MKLINVIVLVVAVFIVVYLIVPAAKDPMEVLDSYHSANVLKNDYLSSWNTWMDKQKSEITNEIMIGATNESNKTTVVGIPKYLQSDYKIPINKKYSGTVSSSGCGYTCYAMIVSWITGEDLTPDKFIDKIVPSTGKRLGDGYQGNGINQTEAEKNIKEIWKIGSKDTRRSRDEITKIVEKELDAGRPVMVGVNNRPWTGNMHRILIVEWVNRVDKTVRVLDPNARSNASREGMSLDDYYSRGWKLPEKFNYYAVVTFDFPSNIPIK